MTPPLLEVRGLVKAYGTAMALAGVDFDVRAGEVHCLLGQNGAGKSTLIKCVSGAVAPTGGEVRLDGELLPVGDPIASIQRGVGTIYQELDLVDDLTVAGNVFLGHEARQGMLVDRRRMEHETSELLERLDHPHIRPRAHVRDLQPAEKQVVSIARALSRRSRLLIMDEPSAVLDDNEVDVLFGVVERLTGQGVGVIYISHRLAEVRRIGDRVTVLKDGASVVSGVPADTDPDTLVGHMVGRRVEEMFPDREPPSEDVVLEVHDLSRGAMVRDVSLQVRAGEIVGVAGLVGSGRTELLRAIQGVDRPDRGSVIVAGQELEPGRPDLAVAAGVGLAPEERKSQGLLLGWSLAKNVSLADLGTFARSGFLDRRAEHTATREALRALGTTPDDPRRLARELSGGNQQKVVLARWLLRDCRLLLLDEPTRGIDVGAKAEIYRVIADLAARGLGVLVVSSELTELIGFCHRILVMSEGRIVAEEPGDTTTEEQILRWCVHTFETGVVSA